MLYFFFLNLIFLGDNYDKQNFINEPHIFKKIKKSIYS